VRYRVVEGDVDAPVGVVSGPVEPLYFDVAAHVGPDEQAADLVGARRPRFAVHVGHHDGGALRGQAPDRGQADTTGTAGDDRHPALEATTNRLLHQLSLRGDKDVLHVCERVGRVGAELATEADCLNPPKGVQYRTEE